ncbi:chaperone modulator CbpM [Actinoallomurus sp. NPDC052274]|uniref:chaperone modulator CbpM n=1 Tax=Actinoallomurus sp. NPDC052274 TaxID=3155420 RepID=UPI003425E110
MRYALMRPVRLDLETFARDAHVHPDLVRRFVALGIVDADRDVSGGLWFSPEQLAVIARVQRLRTGFSLNYAAVGLICDLLDRIAALEAAQRHRAQQRTGGRPWT